MLVTDGCEKVVVKVFCIYYLIYFQKDQKYVKALLNSSSKINAINPAFAQKLSLYIGKINVGPQKINGFALITFGVVITDLKIEDKTGGSRFFKKIILVADIKFKSVLNILFLKISNADMSFGEKILTWKFFITNKALPTTKQVQIVDPKKFVIMAFDANSKTFVVYVAIREQKEMPVHSEGLVQIEAEAQIKITAHSRAQVRSLLFDAALRLF